VAVGMVGAGAAAWGAMGRRRGGATPETASTAEMASTAGGEPTGEPPGEPPGEPASGRDPGTVVGGDAGS
jgi:hypothetical protein